MNGSNQTINPALEQVLRQYAKDALDVQLACNASGVANALVCAMRAIRDAYPNISTRELNQHPIVFMFAYKLLSLNGRECLCTNCGDAYDRAQAACLAIIHPPTQTACEWMRQMEGL